MTIRQIVNAYNRLEKAKVGKLDIEEVIKIIDAREAMRCYWQEFKAVEEDACNKFKFDGIEEVDSIRMSVIKKVKENGSYIPTEEEIQAIEKMNEYFYNVNKVVENKLSKEIDLTLEKLSKTTRATLMSVNGWSAAELDELSILS